MISLLRELASAVQKHASKTVDWVGFAFLCRCQPRRSLHRKGVVVGGKRCREGLHKASMMVVAEPFGLD